MCIDMFNILDYGMSELIVSEVLTIPSDPIFSSYRYSMPLSLATNSSLTESEIHCGTFIYRVWLTFSWENTDLGIIPLLSILTHETYLSTILSQLLVNSKLRVQARGEVGCLQTYIQKDFI